MSRIIVIFCCLTLTQISYAQLHIGNFIGEESDQVNGTWNYEIPLGFPINLKKWKDGDHKLRIYPSYTFSQTFLNDRWIFDSDGSSTNFMLDSDPNHEYKNSIFTYQSKIRTWAWEPWIGIESKLGIAEIHLSYAPSYIQVGSFRRRYVEENEVVKVRDRFRDKADYYNIKRLQHRLKGSFSLYGVGVGGYINLTSFFKEETGIDLQKFGVTLVIRQSFWSNLFNIDLSLDEEEETEPGMKQMKF